ncbi:MAG: DNA translocase FtsK [Firmicutes bacterium]|nr:DNA translocase FtsK [Bacillota bacterium]HQD39576.1 DNA translocase FtsK 4TM domain-containing protein [Bacillota bacterium]
MRRRKKIIKPSQPKEKTEKNKEFLGLGLVVFGLLGLGSLYLTGTGIVGRYLAWSLRYLAGKLAFSIPVLIGLGGAASIADKKKLWRQVGYLAFLCWLLGAFLHLLLPANQRIYAHLSVLGREGQAGGFLGGVLGALLWTLFGSWGSHVVLAALFLVGSLQLAQVPLSQFCSRMRIALGVGFGRACSAVANFFLAVWAELQDAVEVFSEQEQEAAAIEDEEPQKEAQGPSKEEEAKAPPAEPPAEKESRKPEPEQKQQRPQEPVLQLSYPLPTPQILPRGGRRPKRVKVGPDMRVGILEETLKNFGVEAKVVEVNQGPVITRYELEPAPGVKVSKIVSLADDLALSLAAQDVRIEAPIPGKARVGIEVPNKEVQSVSFRELIEDPEFNSKPGKLTFVLGRDIGGKPIYADLSKMPHLLIAGATGSGKSVCLNTIIASFLFRTTPQQVRLIMVDPKRVELSCYEGIPHLMGPVVTDPKQAAQILNWAVEEMEERYSKFAKVGVRNMERYNAQLADKPEEQLPYLVVIIDELADLMMVAAPQVEEAICRLAQMARAAGIHLLIATQRPSVDVITGLIKANITSRIAFAVSSQVDSRTILDFAGAERLLGKGDMLFHPTGLPKPLRIQGAYISDQEVEALVSFWLSQGEPQYDQELVEAMEKPAASAGDDEEDELFGEALRLVVEAGTASVSLLQRRLRIGYARAGRLIDQLEAKGFVGPSEGSKPRKVLATAEDLIKWQE